MNGDYDPDDYEDELQRILEGRDVEPDIDDVYEKSKHKSSNGLKKQRQVVVDDDEGIPEREDDDLDNFIENDYEDGEEPEDAREDREDEAKEVPAKRIRGPRRTILNPRPKLDADRLKSSKGLVALLELHPQIKLKGSGFEESDLNVMMFAIEHWAHRLFPKLAFDDFIEKAETLGSKRAVSTFLRKIRMDLPLDVADTEYVSQFDDDDDKDEAAPVTAESLFDQVLGQEKGSDAEETEPVKSAPVPPAPLSDEQRLVIARKRLEAIQKRRQREAAAEKESSQATESEPSQATETGSSQPTESEPPQAAEVESSQLVSADEMLALMNMDNNIDE